MSHYCHLIIVFITVSIAGCGVTIPECGDPKAVELVQRIVAEQIFGENPASARIAQTIVEGVETISKDEKLKKNQCQASISWKLSQSSLRIIEAINDPSFEKSQALLIGVSLSDEQSHQILALFGGKKPTQQELAELFYKESLKKSNYEVNAVAAILGLNSTFGILQKNIENLLEKGKVDVINGDTIKLSKQKLSYSIRPNEDKGKKDAYVVELKFSQAALEAVGGIEGLVEMEAKGKEVISKLSKPVVQPQPQAQPQLQPQAQPQVQASGGQDGLAITTSFDCSKASASAERLVCSDRELAKLDVELGQAYSKARDVAIDKGKLRIEQNEWIKSKRNACADKSCMVDAYRQRISQLKG